MLIFGPNANINIMDLMMQKRFGAIFFAIENHFEVI